MTISMTLKKVLELTGVLLPAIHAANTYAGAVADLSIKLSKALENPQPNAVIDTSRTLIKVVKEQSKIGAVVMDVGTKGMKALNGDNSSNIDKMLQVSDVVLPIIKFATPTVGVVIEVSSNVFKVSIDYSKSESLNYVTAVSLVSAFVPALKELHKTTGIAVEVFTNFAKTDSGAELLKSVPSMAYNKYQVKSKSGDKEEWIKIYSNDSEFDKYLVDPLDSECIVLDFHFNNLFSEKTNQEENWITTYISESNGEDAVDAIGKDSAGE